MARRTNTTELPPDTGGAVDTSSSSAQPGATLAYEPMNVFTTDEMQKEFMSYLCSEIVDVRDGNDRKELESRWVKWRKQRQAVMDSKQRDTPWIKSANVESSLTMQKVNTIFAKLFGAFAVKKPPVSVSVINSTDRDIADSMERFFKGLHDNQYSLNMRKNQKTIFYNVASLGTEFVKVPFKINQWAFKRKTASGVENVTYIQHKGPAIVPIRLEDFFTRPYWKDLQRAPWLGVRFRYFRHELTQMQAQGLLVDVDKIWNQSLSTYDANLTSALQQAGVSPGALGAVDPNKEYEIYECNVFWDVDGDGIPEDIIAWVEPDTQTLLRAEYNPLSVRDIEAVGYLDDPENLYSVGVCQMTESQQETASALQRMRLDGTKLSMLKMIVARKGTGIGPDEEFYPQKLWLVDDPANDFKVIDFPDIAQSTILGEQLAKEDADRVTGANDYMAGFNDKIVGSNSTVGGTTFLAAQANGVLNSLLENVEQSMTNLYMLALYQCMANKENVDLSFLNPGDATNVMQVLSMDVKDIPTKFRFMVKTTDINKTDESRKQSILMASQLYSTYGQQALQLLQLKMNPQLGQQPDFQELVNSLFVGGTAFMTKILDFFDVGNPDDFLPFVDHIKVQLRAMDAVRTEQVTVMKEQLNGQGTNGSAAPNSGSVQPPPGTGVGPGPVGPGPNSTGPTLTGPAFTPPGS